MNRILKISSIIFLLLLTLIIIVTKPTNILQIITCVLVTTIFISPMLIGEPIANKIYKKAMIENVVIEKKEYQKLLEKYSPAMLYKILTGKIDSYSVLLTIESLIEKKIIKISDKDKIVETNKQMQLSETENYILSKLIKKKDISLNEFNNKLVQEANEQNLNFPQVNKYGLPLIKKIILVEILFVIINIVLAQNNLCALSLKFDQNALLYTISFLIFIIPILLFGLIPIIYITSIATSNIYIDITKVSEIKSKLLALNNYINKDPAKIKDWKNNLLYLNILEQQITVTSYYKYINITK